MLIKDFSIFISRGHSDDGMEAILGKSVEGHPRNISVKLFWNLTKGYEDMSFQDFFYFKI